MRMTTRYFGEIEYGEEEVLHFPRGLYGFEEEKRFLLLAFEGGYGLYSLQSLDKPQLSFLLMHPFSLDPGYAPVLTEEELKELGAAHSEDLCYYVLVAARKPVLDSTVNMKCPIAFNPDTHLAAQTILDDPKWGMRHPLSEFESGEGAAPC